MEVEQEAKKVRRIFTPEQKFEILKTSSGVRRSKRDCQSINLPNRCITSGSGSWRWECERR